MNDYPAKRHAIQLARAVEIAANAHQGQVDKCGQPYILHPLRVMARGQQPEEKIVGVLHDVVEDAHYPLISIRKEFGYEIAEAVDAISRREGETRKQYMARVKANPLATAVKLNDLADNSDPSRAWGTPEQMVGQRKLYAKEAAFLLESPRAIYNNGVRAYLPAAAI